MEGNNDVQETFVNRYPIYTSHRQQSGDANASYGTYLFGLITIAKYNDPEIDAFDVCICEPLRWLGMKLEGQEYIDSLDELIRQIREDKSNIKKVKFKW